MVGNVVGTVAVGTRLWICDVEIAANLTRKQTGNLYVTRHRAGTSIGGIPIHRVPASLAQQLTARALKVLNQRCSLHALLDSHGQWLADDRLARGFSPGQLTIRFDHQLDSLS